jgi:hypothetical protein
MPIGVSQDVLAQVMTDESIDPENENVFQNEPLPTKILKAGAGVQRSANGWCAKAGGAPSGGTGSPLIASRTIRRRRPSTQSAYH